MSNKDVPPHQRSYGRGFIDGLKKAGITDPEQFMNNARLNEIVNGLTGIARKVLEVVPISQAWTAQQIHAELTRNNHHTDRRTVDGCLNSLVNSNVVREPIRGQFTRVMPKPKLVVASEELPCDNTQFVSSSVVPHQPAAAAAVQSEPLDRIEALADRVSRMSTEATRLADEIEAVAVEFADQMKKVSKDGEQLRQLKALLRDEVGCQP